MKRAVNKNIKISEKSNKTSPKAGMSDLLIMLSEAESKQMDKQNVCQLLFDIEETACNKFRQQVLTLDNLNSEVAKKYIKQQNQFILALQDLTFDFINDKQANTQKMLNHIKNWLQAQSIAFSQIALTN